MPSPIETEDVVMGGCRYIVSFTVMMESYDCRCSGCRNTLQAHRPKATVHSIVEVKDGSRSPYDGPKDVKIQGVAWQTYLSRQAACGAALFCDDCSPTAAE